MIILFCLALVYQVRKDEFVIVQVPVWTVADYCVADEDIKPVSAMLKRNVIVNLYGVVM